MNKSWFAFHCLAFSSQFVERYASLFFCREHRRGLVLIADEFIHGIIHLFFSQFRYRFLCNNFSFTVLGSRFYTK